MKKKATRKRRRQPSDAKWRADIEARVAELEVERVKSAKLATDILAEVVANRSEVRHLTELVETQSSTIKLIDRFVKQFEERSRT